MNTKYLTTFVTILEAGSFQKAAAQLNYTQSTVTAQMKQLEEELSLQLFEKVGRRMVLTQAGRDVLPHVRTILQSEAQIAAYGKSLTELTGTLQLAAPDSIFIYLLQPLLCELRRRAPRVRLVVSSLPSEEINQAVAGGMADIAFDCDKGQFPDTVIHRPSTPFRACLIAAPDLAPELRDFTTPHQRKPLSLILNEPRANYQKALEHCLEERDITLEPSMKLQSIEAVKRSVINGLGVAYVPAFSVEGELANGSLIRLDTGLDGHDFPSVCLHHKNRWISPQMELVFQIAYGTNRAIK